MARDHDEINVNVKLCCEHELHKLNHNMEILKQLGDKIMSAISDFAVAQNAFNDRMDVAIADLQGDIKSLTDQIAALQAGQVTPEDQALLNGLSERAKSISDKLDALDALTPPVPPVSG